MPIRRQLVSFVILMTLSLRAIAAPAAAHVEVQGAWARASLPGQMGGAVFMTISSDVSASVTAVATPVAAMAQVHQMNMQGSVMQMRPMAALPLEPGKPAVLNATGTHIMLMDLKRPLVVGEHIPMTLTVQIPGRQALAVPVTVEIRSVSAQ